MTDFKITYHFAKVDGPPTMYSTVIPAFTRANALRQFEVRAEEFFGVPQIVSVEQEHCSRCGNCGTVASGAYTGGAPDFCYCPNGREAAAAYAERHRQHIERMTHR